MSDDEKGHFRAYQDPSTLRQSSLDIIRGIRQITDEYEAQGYVLTVRQIYYQFVSRGWLPSDGTIKANGKPARSYDLVQGMANTGRNCGLLSWTSIEDRGRNLRGLGHYTSPAQAIAKMRRRYRIDMWANQPFRPEFWVEKQALEGVVGQMASMLQVDYYAQKGYNSTSEHWAAAQRFVDYIHKGQRPIVFHLGDLDPSGWHMTQSNIEKLSMYAGVPIMVQRLALSIGQVEQYSPPPFRTKDSDARAADFRTQMEDWGHDGDESYELDALEPPILHGIMKDAVDRIRDENAWDAMVSQEVEDKRLLDEMIETLGGTTEGGEEDSDDD